MESEQSQNVERYRQFFARAEASPEYWSAAAAYEFVRELERRMEEQGVSRADLARRLGTSKAYVTKVLGGDANFTLATMTRLAAALGGTVQVRIADRGTATSPGLSESQKQQLAERLADVKRDPGALLPGEEVEAELRALLAP